MPGEKKDTFKNTARHAYITNDIFTMMLKDLLEEWLFKEFEMKWHFIRYEY